MTDTDAAIEARVVSTLNDLGIEHDLIKIDPDFADTAEFCEKYGYTLEGSGNTIIVASKRGAKKYCACIVQGSARLDVNKTVKKLMSKPTVMAVTCAVSGDPFLDREDYAATCCAIQNIMLAAWEDGIGMQWSTSALIEDAEALSILGVDPERERVVGLLYAGFAERVPVSKRKPAAEVTTWLD